MQRVTKRVSERSPVVTRGNGEGSFKRTLEERLGINRWRIEKTINF